MNEESTQVFQKLFNRLSDFSSEGLSLDLPTFVILLLISLLSSLAISAAYLRFYENRSTGSQIHRAFPLLGLSITTLFVCIQFSLPLSLGLLGALSIVRFRTPIKEPEEIAFIMVLIASSIAIATQNLAFLVALLIVSAFALVILRWGLGPFRDLMKQSFITVTLPNEEYLAVQPQVLDLLERNLKGRIDSVTKNESITVFTYVFDAINHGDLDAVEHELRASFPNADYSLFNSKHSIV